MHQRVRGFPERACEESLNLHWPGHEGGLRLQPPFGVARASTRRCCGIIDCLQEVAGGRLHALSHVADENCVKETSCLGGLPLDLVVPACKARTTQR